jgi:predicted flap endonuclease-1-like 5' DNA nuclease
MTSFSLVKGNGSVWAPIQMLAQPITSLTGVTESSAETLKELGIVTIQDLASSSIFAVANLIDDASEGQAVGDRLNQSAISPAAFLDKSVRDTPIAQLAEKPISIIRGIGAELSSRLESELGVRTISKLANWSPYQIARGMLNAAYGNGPISSEASKAPSDLLPTNGKYATDRSQYEILIFDSFVDFSARPDATVSAPQTNALAQSPGLVRGNGAPIEALPSVRNARPLGSDGPLDVVSLFEGELGYERPAIGGVLTFTQTWYGQGLSLGSLLHSVALAPGESTKIAMIDWSRTTSAATSEVISEQETLYSTLDTSRAINEITSAVASDTQAGASGATSQATSAQSGGATGSSSYGFRSGDWFSSAGSFINNLMNDTPQSHTSGTSWGTSTTNTSASSWSTSTGWRSLFPRHRHRARGTAGRAAPASDRRLRRADEGCR